MYLPGISISNPGFSVFGEASSKEKSEVDDNGDGIGNVYAKINSNANRNGEVTRTTMVMVGMFMNCCYRR